MAKKITSELIAICDYAMTSEDKKLSIVGIFDKVFVRTLPSNHARMAFVVTFAGEPQTTEELRLKILAPSGKEEFAAGIKVNFGENGKFNFVSNFEGFPFNEIGTYRLLFEKDSKEIVSHALDVIQIKEKDNKPVAN